MDAKINEAKRICAYDFLNASQVLAIALSAARNKELAILGDKVIAVYFADRGFEEGWPKSMINNEISIAAGNQRLSEICSSAGLDHCILPVAGQCGPLGWRTQADAVEAVIGAAYKSGGISAAVVVMHALGVIRDGVV